MIITVFWIAFFGAAALTPFVCVYWSIRDFLARK